MSPYLIGKKFVFLGYEDGYEGVLRPGDPLIISGYEGAHAFQVTRMFDGKVEKEVQDTVFDSELGELPLVTALA